MQAHSTNSSQVGYTGEKVKGNSIKLYNAAVSGSVMPFMDQTRGKSWVAFLWVQISPSVWDMTHESNYFQN